MKNDHIKALKRDLQDAVSPYRIPWTCRMRWHRWGPWDSPAISRRMDPRFGFSRNWFYQQRRCMGCGRIEQRWIGIADKQNY